MRKVLVIAIFLSVVFLPLGLVLAEDGGTGGPDGGTGGPDGGTGGISISVPNPLGNQNFVAILRKVVNFLIAVAIPITALMIIYGAYQIMFAGGDTEKVTSGKRTILYTVAGFVIILLAWSIIEIIKNILGVSIP